LLEITFELRKEIWNDSIVPRDPAESNFQSVQIANQPGWKESLLNDTKLNFADRIRFFHSETAEEKMIQTWKKGQLFFYNAYSETINLLQQLITLTALLREQKIQYIIYRGNPVENLQKEYLLDFFSEHLENDPGVLNLFNFSFTKWTLDNGFSMVNGENNYTGHPDLEAHREFAKLLIDKL
jgi:hypothetical protein